MQKNFLNDHFKVWKINLFTYKNNHKKVNQIKYKEKIYLKGEDFL